MIGHLKYSDWINFYTFLMTEKTPENSISIITSILNLFSIKDTQEPKEELKEVAPEIKEIKVDVKEFKLLSEVDDEDMKILMERSIVRVPVVFSEIYRWQLLKINEEEGHTQLHNCINGPIEGLRRKYFNNHHANENYETFIVSAPFKFTLLTKGQLKVITEQHNIILPRIWKKTDWQLPLFRVLVVKKAENPEAIKFLTW